MNDLIALKAMLTHGHWVKYGSILFKLENLQPEFKLILSAIKDYYQKYPELKEINVDELEVFFKYLNPALKKPELYAAIFEKIRTVQVTNQDLVVDVLNSMVARHIAAQMGVVATQIVQESMPAGKGITQLEGLLQQHKDIIGDVQDSECDVCRTPFEEMFNPDSEKGGIPFRMAFMRNAFGNLTGGALGHIFARPDAGKTSFALNQATGMAHHLYLQDDPRCILYLQNEEGDHRVRARSVCAMFHKTPQEVIEHMERLKTKWKENYESRFKIIGSVTEVTQVEKYIQVFKPAVVFIDQGPKVNINTRKDSSGVERLQKLYNRYRELAKEYGPDIITLGQADNNAQNKKFLSLNNLDQSKVAIQGELDWCLGIGYHEDPMFESIRWLSVVKNKFKGIYPKNQVTFSIPACEWKD